MTETRTRRRTQAPERLPSDPHDRGAMLAEVLAGLALPQKELSPKYFYDAHGSALFERITELEEYYPTRTERALLERWMPVWTEELRPAALVELGAGSAAKSRVILDAMQAHAPGGLYVPLDVSGELLHDTAERLRSEYDGLRVEPAVADMVAPLELPVEPPEPTWYALLGSTIGNFDEGQAVRLLARIARRLRPGDRFLMGADLRPGPRKSRDLLERAYNDADGVTAAFNLNVLRVLDRELGANFDLSGFRHHAFYDERFERIEMHLVSTRRQTVTFPGGASVDFERGESLRTEISCKHDRGSVDALYRDAGLEVERWEEDEDALFTLVLGRRTC